MRKHVKDDIRRASASARKRPHHLKRLLVVLCETLDVLWLLLLLVVMARPGLWLRTELVLQTLRCEDGCTFREDRARRTYAGANHYHGQCQERRPAARKHSVRKERRTWMLRPCAAQTRQPGLRSSYCRRPESGYPLQPWAIRLCWRSHWLIRRVRIRQRKPPRPTKAWTSPTCTRRHKQTFGQPSCFRALIALHAGLGGGKY